MLHEKVPVYEELVESGGRLQMINWLKRKPRRELLLYHLIRVWNRETGVTNSNQHVFGTTGSFISPPTPPPSHYEYHASPGLSQRHRC